MNAKVPVCFQKAVGMYKAQGMPSLRHLPSLFLVRYVSSHSFGSFSIRASSMSPCFPRQQK